MIQIDNEHNDGVSFGLSDNIILEQSGKTINCKYYDKDNLNSKFKQKQPYLIPTSKHKIAYKTF